MAPIDPQLAAEAAAVYAGVKATNEAAKLPVVAPVVAVLNAQVQAFAERHLRPALRRVLRLEEAAEVASAEAAARLADVPAEQLLGPAPAIAAGVVVALQTRADEPELRALFAELLASACRRDRADVVHLAFVDVLNQLEPDEARLLDVVRAVGQVPAWSEHVDLAGSQPTQPTFTMRLPGPRELAESPRLGAFQGNLLRLGLLVMHTRVTPRTLYHGAGADMVTTATFGVSDFGHALLAVCAPDGVLPAPLTDDPTQT